jgi:hypothetical protein
LFRPLPLGVLAIQKWRFKISRDSVVKIRAALRAGFGKRVAYNLVSPAG